MSSIVVSGDTSGAVTLSAPAVAGTVTVTLPSTSGVMAVGGGTITTLTTTSDITVQGLTVGRGAGAVATNTAVGASALAANTSGATSVAVGNLAAQTNSTGSNITAIGYKALNLSTADNNTAVGMQAGRDSTTATNNVFMGKNTAVQNTTGSSLVGIGVDALFSNTTASNNTAVGYQAGYTNSTGTANTFTGYQAGYTSNATAANGYNTATGYQAGKALTTGIQNSFFGFGSGQLITSGGKNTILGAYDGNTGGLDIRTASNYIVLSDGDGNPRCYWTNNGVMVQSISYTDNYVAQIKNSTATRPYGLYINFSAATPNNTTENFLNCADSTNEKCIIYSSGTVTNRTGTYNAFSDIKLKQDVVDAGSQWDDIKAVRVRKFRLKDDVVANPETKHLIGVIAQELELTSAGLIDDCVDKEGDVTKSVKYSILYMKAVKALQEAMERIEQLEARLDAANL